MNLIIFILYALWAIACIVLKILGICTLGEALSFIWLPAGVAFSIALILALLTGFTKKKVEKPTCENCLFRKTQQLTNEEECLGEKLGLPKNGECCANWTKV